MNQQQSALLNNLTIIKPNFHAFTAKFHSKLAQSSIEMNYPTALQFNEKSFTLFCVLERIVKHLDKPASVAPFLAHHLMYLKKAALHTVTLPFYLTLFTKPLKSTLVSILLLRVNSLGKKRLGTLKALQAMFFSTLPTWFRYNKECSKSKVIKFRYSIGGDLIYLISP
ncbi:hypothetical protein P4S66_09085 [Pseudoalteromonas sp. B129b]